MKVDPKEVLGSLVEDALVPAKEAGKEVNVRATEEYFVGVLEKLEHKQADAKPKAKTEKKDGVASEFKKATGRELDPSTRTTKKATTLNPMQAQQSKLRQVGELLLRERLRWIRQRPDLFAQVKGLALLMNHSDPQIRAKAEMTLREFLVKTNKLAGHDWRKPPPGKLVFSG